jgi:nucleoside-diphosphate-sugar epimerase
MKVLVTGASGFVGRCTLAPLVEAGHEVHAVARRPDPAGSVEQVRWHTADLLDRGEIQALVARVRAELLLHLAWYAEPGAYWTSPENLSWVGATLELLRAFQECGGRRAVLVGSCAEYDWTVAAPSFDESSSPLAPGTLYGTAKHATHLVANSYAAGCGLELAWARLFFLYGPGEPSVRLVPAVATALIEGREASTTEGIQVRDFMHAADAGRALVAVCDSGVQGAVNIASGEGVRVRDIVELVAQATGRRELLRVGTRAQAPGEPERIVANVARLRDEVRFAPAIDLRAGIERTVEWWRNALG